MRAGQTLVDNGHEVALFPLEYMNISQGEGGTFSHAGTYNIDFLGWDANGRVYQCPYYAPCTLKCVNTTFAMSDHARTYESVNPVYLADGTLDYLTIVFMHDDNPVYNVGDIIPQGNLIGHTGTTGPNVTGDHVHMGCGKGTYIGFTQRASGRWDLSNRTHIYDALYVNDTTIINGYGYNWKTYQGGGPIPPTPTTNKTKFKWVLYARKLRERNY